MHGSTVVCTFTSPQMKKASHFNFVIADDDQDDQQTLLQAFKENFNNYSSFSVYDGRELMDYLLKEKEYLNDLHSNPDFIFLDINMPLQNGYEVLKELKAHNELKKIPVYVFSTACSVGDRKIMMGLGAEKCFIKPSLFAEYKKIIEEVITA